MRKPNKEVNLMKRDVAKNLTLFGLLFLFTACGSNKSEGPKIGEMQILLTVAPGDFEQVPMVYYQDSGHYLPTEGDPASCVFGSPLK